MLQFGTIPEYRYLVCYQGTQEEFLLVNWDVMTQQFGERKERILFSSIRHPSGQIFAVLNPGRHHHCIRYMAMHGYSNRGKHRIPGKACMQDQGFLTNFGRHVDRDEAFLIATASGQPITKSDYPDSTHLFSECVWNTPELYYWKESDKEEDSSLSQ